ncbi:toll/interleukin-1 receptor domain-containing protein [Burkholderia cepacia]|uniref:toll/interleukin-1 receptor domain-containing protein n=1 Tax=Burkholderia cepacia TaxID=292 RepID=UPI000F596D61|nr:toll/interleukin-1 receptor domain-containing protein [Burkholderia cepacia]RQT56435.1 toll/interleukin-1 receptor domain-containing protein [Burkholderia cepacia]
MQSASPAPKVFVSHASEDKQRFVIPFATALRERGIDAWVDRWEMLPGDSLVDKIFEEGLKDAAAVVIVLSEVSVTKPWVREELNTAVVTRIQKGTKIIPIVLDGCEVPEALKSLLWESVKDVNDFEDCLARVVDAIFGHTSKPPIGAAPAYVQSNALPQIGGLTASDRFVLKAVYEGFLKRGGDYVSPEEILAAATDHGLDATVVSDSLDVLEHQGYIEQRKHLGPGPYISRIQPYGVSMILGDEEQPLIRKVGLCLANDGITDCAGIASATGEPQSLVDHAITRLENQGLVKALRGLGGVTIVHQVSPMLRRSLAT